MKISNWGNYPVVDTNVRSFTNLDELRYQIANSNQCIARGLGRCYGDSSLHADKIISTTRYNRIIAFDETSGRITCEAGVSLEEILQIFAPRGWFLPVTPGTKFITIGGAIASDVHGKNHHVAGAFSNQVESMDVMLWNGEIQTCSKSENPDLFWATCGGMGLTGIITQATFCLIPIESTYINQETVKAKNIDEIMEIFETSHDWSYSVAWIDCLSSGDQMGRSIMMRGEFATKDDLVESRRYKKPLRLPSSNQTDVPIMFPGFVLNPLSVKAFNFAYYHKAPKGKHASTINYDTFFYPLDSINNWNRIYGKRGFTQYQFVLPKESSKEGLKKILGKIASSGQGSFLAVLKLFGQQDDLISFPREGYTLALDFPITAHLFALLDELDSMVKDFDGRLYLTKDVRMSERMFKETYPNVDKFLQLRHNMDPKRKFQSLQSKRLGI